MSPWHSKIATEQDLVKKGSECVHRLLTVKWKAFLPLTSKDGKITLTFSTPLWHLSAPLKSPPAPARKLCFLDLQLLNLQLQDLHIVVLQLLDEPPATGPPFPGSPPPGPTAHGPQPASMGASPAKEGLIKGKPQLTQKLHRCCRLCKLFQNKISRAILWI